MSGLYLLGLVVGLLGLGFIDWQHRLALFVRPKLTIATVLISVSIYLLWDIVGISYGIFFSGHSPFMLGQYILPNLPLEELFFLTLLTYLSLLLYRGYKQWRRISS